MDEPVPAPGAPPQRDQLRQLLVQRRRALAEHQVAAASADILEALRAEASVTAATQRGPVGVYWPVRGEPDPRAVPAPHGRSLPGHPGAQPQLLAWGEGAHLERAWRHLRYPAAGSTVVDAADHGLILVPAVAFDRAGNRLGNGAGWYDRLLAPLAQAAARPRPLLVGVAHAFQVIDALVARPWDVAMDLVVTPEGVMDAR